MQLNPKIQQILNDPRYYSLLHDLFSGLRGPDEMSKVNDELKFKYTAPIRCYVWGTVPGQLHRIGSSIGEEAPVTLTGWKILLENLQAKEITSHYVIHLLWALTSIIKIETMVEEGKIVTAPQPEKKLSIWQRLKSYIQIFEIRKK